MIETVESIEGIIGGEQQLEGALNVSKAEPILQEKTTTPTKELQNIVPDENYDGLSKVVVNAIPEQYIIPSGTINITEDGTYDVKQYETAQVQVDSDTTIWYSQVYKFSNWENPNTTSVTTAGDFAYSGDDVKALYKGHTINMVRLVPAQAGIITLRVYNNADDIVGRRDTASLRTNQIATITITQEMVNKGGYQEIEMNNDLVIGENQFWTIQTAGDTGRFKFRNISQGQWVVSEGYKMYNQLGTTSAVTIFPTGALCVDVGYKKRIPLQEKTITIEENGETTILPDENYDGLSKVNLTVNVALPDYLPIPRVYVNNYAYIQTNIIASNNIEVEVQFLTTGGSNKPLFGTQAGANYYHLTLYNNSYYWGLNNGEAHGGTTVLNVVHTIIFNNDDNKVVLDGNVIGDCTGTTSPYPLKLFTRDTYYFNNYIYYVKIRNKTTNTYLMDLTPVIQYKDVSRIGMGFYDKVSKQYIGSSGSGSFA